MQSQYRVIFTIKEAIHPLNEIVTADDCKAAEQIVRQMCLDAGVTIKQVVSVIEL